MYKNVSPKWSKNVYKKVQKVLNVYFDDVLVDPDYITDFKPRQ